MSGVIPEADAWVETEEEAAVRTAEVTSQKPLKVLHGGINVSFDVELGAVGRFVFKPKSGEQAMKSSVPVGTYFRREAAAFRVDRLFGFGLVPVTVIREVKREIGSVQAWVDIEGWSTGHRKDDEARMAVLDYVLGNIDRHVFNWRTQSDGRPSAIDNGLCLPLDSSEPLRSRWIHVLRDKELSEQVMLEVMRVSPDRAKAVLSELKIEKAAIAGLLERLREVQEARRITLAAWAGDLRRS